MDDGKAMTDRQTDRVLLLQCRPCLTIPHSREPQWSQKVGALKLWLLNLWGTLILKPWFVDWNMTRTSGHGSEPMSP